MFNWRNAKVIITTRDTECIGTNYLKNFSPE